MERREVHFLDQQAYERVKQLAEQFIEHHLRVYEYGKEAEEVVKEFIDFLRASDELED